jgi:hypothetical protein
VSLTAETERIYCPYCGERIEVLVDASITRQCYIEDCSVCCRPIELAVTVMDDEVTIDPRRDDE